MTNQEKYAQQMQDAGVCDARGAALCATVKELPDGSFGMVLLGVKGNDLLIYDTNMKSEPLKLMHTIPLKGVTDFSTTSLMGEILKGYTFRFTSDGFTYSFKNCRRQAFLERIGGRWTNPAGAPGRGRTEPHLHAAPQEGGVL